MSATLAEASQSREERLLNAEMDKRINLLLEGAHVHTPDPHFARVTANPRSMGYLRFLLRHYAKDSHPWTRCVADNTKRFGPEKTKALCGVLKDIIRQRTDWRHGAPRGPHPGHPDVGSPGVAIGEADKWAAPAWGGHHHLSDEKPQCVFDALDVTFGAVDHFSEGLSEAIGALVELRRRVPTEDGVLRVLVGIDEPPDLSAKESV